MTPGQRIRAIRLAQMIQETPEVAKRLGISVRQEMAQVMEGEARGTKG